MNDEDGGLRALLLTLDPKARDDLRRVLIRDQADRDPLSSRLMRYRDLNGQDWADIIDFLRMYPDARRKVVRVLAEIDSGSSSACLCEEVANHANQVLERLQVEHVAAVQLRKESRTPTSRSIQDRGEGPTTCERAPVTSSTWPGKLESDGNGRDISL
jgi:hypothetical protein